MKPTLLFSILLAMISVAQGITFTGDTTGGSTWNRLIGGNPPVTISGFATAVRYEAIQFTVDGNGSYVFQSTANWDNYSFLYHTSFNPLAQLNNVLIGNDDNPQPGLSGFTYALTAGTQYWIVQTGFDNNSYGAYSTTITGPGNVSLGTASVPDSLASGAALFAVSILLLGLRERFSGSQST